MDFLAKLIKRSLIKEIYPESQVFRDKLIDMLKQPVTIYAGFDVTSDSLHVGHLVSLMNLLHFRRNGHQVICVVGDATARIGDPSGHLKDRNRINEDLIKKNTRFIESTLESIFANHDRHFGVNSSSLKPPIIVKNSDWYQGVNVINFVDDIFRQVRVGGLLHKKSVSDRLSSQEGMNMAEFSYQIFQAYDWIKLRQLYDCRLQLGGSDQAGNIYTGHETIKKITGHGDAIGLLTPLIIGKGGKKLGKTSEQGCQGKIWLRPERTTREELYRFFHRAPDNQLERNLNIFTFYEDEEIDKLLRGNLNTANKSLESNTKLAEHVCMLVHGSSEG